MTGRDGRDDANDFESTDWLLAQLGQGRRPDLEGHDAPPPVAEPSVEPAAEPIAPPPAAEVEAEPVDPRARRSEETLDWFSLAEPAPSSSDAATRALPVVGEPIEPRAEPAPPAASAPVAQPTWTPPSGVRPPSLPQSPPPVEPSRLTAVEPPVGAPPVTPPAAAPPVAPVDAPPVVPPGPVTPTASFALTWGDGPIDSEEGLREAFRRLAGPSGEQGPDAAATPAPAEPPSQPESPTQSPAAPQPVVDEPFTAYTPPHASSSSFSPAQPPPSAPRSWDEIAAAAAATPLAAEPAPGAAAEPTPEPQAPAQAGPAGDDGLAQELWAALNEPVAPSPAPEPPTASPAAPQTPPPAPATPDVPPAFQAFGAFGDFGAAVAAEPPNVEPPNLGRAAEPRQPEAPAQPEIPAPPRSRFTSFADDTFEPPVRDPFDRQPHAGASQPGDDPFDQLLPVRDAELPGPPVPQTPPHQSFTPASFGTASPVDDLLAALGGATHGHDRGTFGQAAIDDVPVDVPDRAANPLTGPIALAFTELGLAFGDTAVRSARGDERAAAGRNDGDAGDRDDSDSAESSIARQIAETGYFWNLTPDPTGVDPKAPQDDAEAAAGRRRAAAGEAEPEPEPDEFDPFAHTRPDSDPANPLTDPFGMRLVFGDERVPPAAAAAAAASDADWRGGPDTAAPAPGASGDPLASLFGAGTGPVDAPFPDSQPDPWATAGYGAVAGAAASPVARPAAPATAAGPAGPGAPVAPTSPRTGGSGGGGRSPARILAWIAGGLVAALVLAGLFFLGTQLTGGARTATSASESAAPSTPAAAPEPTAPQPVGVHAWNTLFGGECLDPFTDPWAQEFTVVDCTVPHAAQLVYRGTLPGDAAAPFPGEAELAAQMPALCSAAGIFDLSVASLVNDLQVQGTFPLADQWADGNRTYYCFANRTSGQPLTASVQGPGPQA